MTGRVHPSPDAAVPQATLVDASALRRAPQADALLLAGADGRCHYRLGARLGEGGNGTVYLARQLETGGQVAIKLLRDDAGLAAAQRQALRARFRRETELCARQAHPHVVALLDQGQTARGQLFAVFEYVPGRTLHDVLATHGPLPVELALHLMVQVLDGLDHVHRQGVVHRDLKPRNIMVAMIDGVVQAKILDFGIGALLPHLRADGDPNLTRTGEWLGSPRYCSPEQLRCEPLTPRSDLYAWGLVLLECLTGQAATPGRSVDDILRRQLSVPDVILPPAIGRHPLGRVLRAALRKNPQRRVATAAELLQQLRALPPCAAPQLSQAVGHWFAPAPSAANDTPRGAVLCCRIAPAGASEPPDALLDAWLAHCAEIAARHGGKLRGLLDDTLLFAFDSPPSAVLAAARAALAILRRPAGDGGRVAVAAAVHDVADGVAARAAEREVVRLQRMAVPGEVLLSRSAWQSAADKLDASCHRPRPAAVQVYRLWAVNGGEGGTLSGGCLSRGG